MPGITKVIKLDVTPEQFVDACDEVEFQILCLACQSRIERENRVKQTTLLESIEELSNNKNK